MNNNNQFDLTSSQVTGVEYESVLNDNNFKFKGWLWSHSSIRLVFSMVNKKLNDNWKPTSRNEIIQVVDAIKEVDQYLLMHHQQEDNIAWPWLIDNVGQQVKPMLDEMDRQHHELDDLSAQLNNQLEGIIQDTNLTSTNSNGWNAVINNLKNTHNKVFKSVVDHMKEEERLLVPIIANIDPAEQEKMISKMRDNGKSAPKFGFCAMIDTGSYDPLIKKSIDSSLPWVVRTVLPYLWSTNYKKFTNAIKVL